MLTKSYDNKEETLQLIVISVVSVGFLIFWYLSHDNLAINEYKYPPQILYILYGCIMPLIIWWSRRFFNVAREDRKNCIINWLLALFKFVGQNTLWIYLWHIPFVLFANRVIPNAFVRYMFVISSAIIFYSLQYYVVKRIGKYQKLEKISRYFVG